MYVMYVCMHACMHACMHVCMYVGYVMLCYVMYVCMYVCNVCNVCMYVVRPKANNPNFPIFSRNWLHFKMFKESKMEYPDIG